MKNLMLMLVLMVMSNFAYSDICKITNRTKHGNYLEDSLAKKKRFSVKQSISQIKDFTFIDISVLPNPFIKNSDLDYVYGTVKEGNKKGKFEVVSREISFIVAESAKSRLPYGDYEVSIEVTIGCGQKHHKIDIN